MLKLDDCVTHPIVIDGIEPTDFFVRHVLLLGLLGGFLG
jgi:hypothetical protein